MTTHTDGRAALRRATASAQSNLQTEKTAAKAALGAFWSAVKGGNFAQAPAPVDQALESLWDAAREVGTKAEDHGAAGDGTTDDRAALHKAFQANPVVILKPDETYLISDTLEPPDGAMFVCDGSWGQRATIKIAGGLPGMHPVVQLENRSDVWMFGLRIDGNKDKQNATVMVGEENGGLHCVRAEKTEGFYAAGCDFETSGGDGLYWGKNNKRSSEGYLWRTDCDGNARNGISVTGGTTLHCFACRLRRQEGQPPQAGIDVEPNGSANLVEDVWLYRCEAKHNKGRGLMVDLFGPRGKRIMFIHCLVADNGVDDEVKLGARNGNELVDSEVINCRVEKRIAIGRSGGSGTATFTNVKVTGSSAKDVQVLGFSPASVGNSVSGNVLPGGVTGTPQPGLTVGANPTSDTGPAEAGLQGIPPP